MPYGSGGGQYHNEIIGCCVSPGTVGWVRGKSTEEWMCKVIGSAYSQCVPFLDVLPPSPPPPAGERGVPCQQKPYGGCGGTHTSASTCCVAPGTVGYDLTSGMRVRTEEWACRSWRERSYSQCLPTATTSNEEPSTPMTVQPAPRLAESAPSLKAAACQSNTYGRCDKDLIGCCVPSGTTGFKDGQKTTKWGCSTWKGKSYKQCLPEV